MLWVSRVRTYEARMSYLSQVNWQEQNPIATLSDTELEANLKDSDQEGIVSTFTTTVDLSKEFKELVDEEEELIESKFEDMDEKYDIHTTYSKLYKSSKML